MSVQEKLFGTAAVMAARNPLVPKGAVAAESDTGVVKVGDGATRYNSLSTALNGTYAKPDVIAPAATGVAATDTANLQAAINATPSGGMLWIRPGTYKINAALTLAGQITIEGTSAIEVMGSASSGDTTSLNAPPVAPYLSGAVIVQTTAATDAFQLSAVRSSPR